MANDSGTLPHISAERKEAGSPLVTIVILNWNGQAHVHRCVAHVVAQSYQPIEVIIVDNGSSDGSLQQLKTAHPGLIYIENSENRGYAAGMNQGIVASRGAFIIPLNQDVCLHPEYVAECVRRITKDQEIGAIGGRIFAWVGDELTDRIRTGEGENYLMRKRFQADAGNVSAVETWTFAPSGSCPFFRRKMLEDVYETSGYYYDEAFETGWEDGDLYFRMHLRGWKCLFLPSALAWHVGSGSVGGRATLISKDLDYQVRVLRNRYFTIAKNLPGRMLLWLSPWLILTEFAIPPYFLMRSPRTLRALVSAWMQFARALPQVARKRARIQKSRKVPPLYLKRYFLRF